MSQAKGETLVAIGLIRRGDTFLVGRRAAHELLPGYAEFPGGKCLPHEPPEVCVVRECLEETGLPIQVVGRRAESVHEYPHGRLRLVFFDCVLVMEMEPRPPFRWVARGELTSLQFPDGNTALLRELVAES